MIRLSDHFTTRRLLRFTLPSITMMLFTSVYLVVDGYFVSNFVGKNALATVNMIYPVIMIVGAIGFMFGTGGSALVAKTLGEGDEKKARKRFSTIYLASALSGLAIALPAMLFLPEIAAFLGATGELLGNCIIYGRILLLTSVLFLIQMESQIFFVAAEKPRLGLMMTVCACGTNMVLDYLFCALFRWGIPGAAGATAISQAIGGIIPLLYFSINRKGKLYFVRPEPDFRTIRKSASNGLSELVSNISSAVVSMLFNARLLHFAGEDGVAAYSVLMYVSMVFVAVFLGLSSGSAPVISYCYGAENHEELKSLTGKLITLTVISSLFMLAFSITMARPLSHLFVGYDEALYEMTVRGFLIYSLSFLFAGVSIFASSFFTALNNGIVSAVISLLRTFILQTLSVLILPRFLGLDGIWLSIDVAEVIAFFLSLFFLLKLRKTYHY